jgi:hypothetical protein
MRCLSLDYENPPSTITRRAGTESGVLQLIMYCQFAEDAIIFHGFFKKNLCLFFPFVWIAASFLDPPISCRLRAQAPGCSLILRR